MSKLLIALGGNALGKTPKEQLELVKQTATTIVDLIEQGHEIVLTHGNGPQVGMINLAFDKTKQENNFDMPFAECNAMSEGYIGYHLQQSITNELRKRKINKNCVTVITEVLVNKNDQAFENPTKPIGLYYTKEEKEQIEKESPYILKEEKNKGYRRVVPSPKPIDIIEINSIKDLIEKQNIVIALGGGGIPVIEENDTLKGIDAVIDKDLSSSLLAEKLGVDKLVILTNVEKVYLNYNTDQEIKLDILEKEKIKEYIKSQQFAPGSMLPKIQACLNFIENTNKEAIITSLLSAKEALEGKTGTLIRKKLNKKIENLCLHHFQFCLFLLSHWRY